MKGEVFLYPQNEDKAEDLLTNIDDMIIWRWFK